MTKNDSIMKKITLLIMSAFALAACGEQKHPVQIAQASASVASAPSVSKEEAELNKEIDKAVLASIKEQIEAGKLKKEDVTPEMILKLRDTMRQAIGTTIKENAIKMTSENVFADEASKALADIVRKNVPSVQKINEIRPLPQSTYFLVFANDNGVPIITNKTGDFYVTVNGSDFNSGLNNLINKNGKPVELIERENGEVVPKTEESLKDALATYQAIVKSIDLDFVKPITHKYGNGEKQVFVFTDPDCPFCKKLDKILLTELTDKDNITIHYIMNPLDVLHPMASKKAADILCAADPHAAWLAWQKDGVVAPEAKDIQECKVKLERHQVIGDLIGVFATPTILTDNGKLIQGVPKDKKAFLESIK